MRDPGNEVGVESFKSRWLDLHADFSFDLHDVGKKYCSPDSHDNSSLVEVHVSPGKLS